MRETYVQIRCSKDEKEKFEENAKRAGKKDVSDFVRSRCLDIPETETLRICLNILSGVITHDNLSSDSLGKMGIPVEMQEMSDFEVFVKTKSIDILLEAIC